MNDGISITFALWLKPEAVAGFVSAGQNILIGTSDFPGFKHIRIVRHDKDPGRLIFIERWETEDAYKNYIAWRTETGAQENLKLIADKTETNIWPTVISDVQNPVQGKTMGVSVTFAVTLKPELIQTFIDTKDMFKDTTRFPGFRSIRMVQHRDDPARFLFIENWDSAAEYQIYLDWQIGQGAVDGLRQNATSLDIDIWSTIVAYA